ncbi:MAG: DNA repair protein RecO C-terminal domain-containing protein [Bacteroidales bacterium]|nr:DNA repair protein RecO C-terminal domain-containing protein [Bacteroidales bacterium]
MKQSAELIVLSTTKVGEGQVVVHTLSKEFGRRGFIVHPGKKTPAALFLPLNILEADVVENPKSQLWSLKDISALDALGGIRGNLHKNTISLFLSEVLFRTVREGAYEDGLYEWCVRSILTLDALDGDFSNFHVLWLLDFAAALGFRPSLEDILPFAGEDAPLFKELMSLPFGEAMLVPLSGTKRTDMCESILRYLEFHTDQSIRVKSLAVLRELYK